jgi:hypothetical protein
VDTAPNPLSLVDLTRAHQSLSQNPPAIPTYKHPLPLGSEPIARLQSTPPPPLTRAFEVTTSEVQHAATMDCNRWHPFLPPILRPSRSGLSPPLIPVDGAWPRLQTCPIAISYCKLGHMLDRSIGTDNAGPAYDYINNSQFSATVSSNLDPHPQHRLI